MKIKRRTFLRAAGLGGAGLLWSACIPKDVQETGLPNKPTIIQETSVQELPTAVEETAIVNNMVFTNVKVPFSFHLVTRPDQSTMIEILSSDIPVWTCPYPIEIEHFYSGKRTVTSSGYISIQRDGDVVEGKGQAAAGGTRVDITDRWSLADDILHLDRSCKVAAEGAGGFLTRFRLNLRQTASPRVFIPGMVYGSSDHLTPAAIGGADTWNPNRDCTVLIREDRMPAPLAACFITGGIHLACFDANPTGEAPMRDTQDTLGQEMVLDGMSLNALGFEKKGPDFSALFCSPANEGEVTYQGTTYPGGQLKTWRRRYQLLRAGAEVKFSLAMRISKETTFPEFAVSSWQAVFAHLNPKAQHHDIEQITDALVKRMVCQVQDIPGGGRGLPNFVDLISKAAPYRQNNNAILGFTGKNIEAANFMLRWADEHAGPEGDLARREGAAIIARFIQLKVNPPEAEGFSITTGQPQLAIPASKRVYLRSFGDDMKSLARAYLREVAAGRAHADWRAWMESFGSWLLGQQRNDGSFPRAWQPVTGKIVEDSSSTTYSPIPFLVHMYQITGDQRYLDAAVRAGEFCWSSGHANFIFVGGTIDNPDIIDKEAGTLSLEAYLALQHGTKDAKWISRAEMAAHFAETFITLWNIPMSPEEDDTQLQWKKGVPTIGLSIIATGHSLVDEYMAFDVDEFAKVFRLTGNSHFLDVARLLLHGTKSMISLPGRLFDLGEDGWQQEHWSLAPRRGYGLHRGWLPWVTTSHLAGIYDLKDFDLALYHQLVNPV